MPVMIVSTLYRIVAIKEESIVWELSLMQVRLLMNNLFDEISIHNKAKKRNKVCQGSMMFIHSAVAGVVKS